MTISLAVRRSLQQCAQPDGTFAMLAIDQRGSLIKAMVDNKGSEATYAEISAFKREQTLSATLPIT